MEGALEQGSDISLYNAGQLAAAQYAGTDFKIVSDFIVLVRVADALSKHLVSNLNPSAGLQRSTEIQSLGCGQEFDSKYIFNITQDRQKLQG